MGLVEALGEGHLLVDDGCFFFGAEHFLFYLGGGEFAQLDGLGTLGVLVEFLPECVLPPDYFYSFFLLASYL